MYHNYYIICSHNLGLQNSGGGGGGGESHIICTNILEFVAAKFNICSMLYLVLIV